MDAKTPSYSFKDGDIFRSNQKKEFYIKNIKGEWELVKWAKSVLDITNANYQIGDIGFKEGVIYFIATKDGYIETFKIVILN